MSAFSLFFFLSISLSLFYIAFAIPDRGSSFSYEPSFSFSRFEESVSSSGVTPYGDASLSDSVVAITNGSVGSSGGIIYRNPIPMFRGSARKSISFISCFSFSLSPGDGGSLLFGFTPKDLIFIDDEAFSGNSTGFWVKFAASAGILSIVVRDAPRVVLVMKGGERLNCCVEYDSNSRVVDVRLGNSSSFQRLLPVISYAADLSKVWQMEMFAVICGSSKNSSQIAAVYSWSLSKRYSAFTLHSEPLNPGGFPELGKDTVNEKKKSSSVLGILVSLFVGIAFGMVVAMCLLLMKRRYFKKNSIAPTEIIADSLDLECEKAKTVGDKVAVDDAKRDKVKGREKRFLGGLHDAEPK